MAYTANAGWSDPNVYGPYSRALKLCESHGTIREKATVLWGSTIAKLVNCELTKGLKHAQDFVRRAEEWRDDEAVLMAYTAAVIANFFLGRLEQASELAALISARYNPREHGKLVQIYQHDPLIVSLVYSGHIEWLLGRPGRARECCETARQLANEIGHPFMLAFASILGVSDHWYEGDLSANLASVKRGLKVADEYGYPMYRVIGPLWATAALAARGPAPEVLEQLCGLLGKLPAENRCIQMPLYRILLATEFGRIGEIERARSFAASAEASGEANRRALGCSRDLSDPRLAAVSRTIARRPGCHALVQTLACLCQKARGGRLGIAHGDQHRAPGQRRRERIRTRRSTRPADIDPGEICIRGNFPRSARG